MTMCQACINALTGIECFTRLIMKESYIHFIGRVVHVSLCWFYTTCNSPRRLFPKSVCNISHSLCSTQTHHFCIITQVFTVQFSASARMTTLNLRAMVMIGIAESKTSLHSLAHTLHIFHEVDFLISNTPLLLDQIMP